MEEGSLSQVLAKAVLVLVPMILSLSVHEFAHAWAAKRLGDDTAAGLGRLTLNPLAHADLVGTILLPLLLLGQGLPFFGWAKPVPFNPAHFTRRVSIRTGAMLVAAAGPLSNLLLAFLCASLLSGTLHSGATVPDGITLFLTWMTRINIGLFIFNMIPVAPLDGQKVLAGLLSGPVALRYERLNHRFGWVALILVVLFAGDLIAVPIQFVTAGVAAAVGLG